MWRLAREKWRGFLIVFEMGTTRDLLLGRTVWWTQDPTELLVCVAASLLTFFFITRDITRRKGMFWSDAGNTDRNGSNGQLGR